MTRPVLLTTQEAALFVAHVRYGEATEETLKAAREHVYYLAKQGVLTRHGQPKRGLALWDFYELAQPYRQITILPLP